MPTVFSRLGGPNVTLMFPPTVLDMGIPKVRAELALRETSNAGVEVAAEWLFSHQEVGYCNR